MLRVGRALLVPLLVAALGASPCAAEGRSSHEDAALAAAKKVVEAYQAKDGAALQALAKPNPDPWIVADEVLALGAPEAAAAFVGALDRESYGALSAYLATHEEGGDAAAARAALHDATALWKAGLLDVAIAILDAAAPPPDTILGVRVGLAQIDVLAERGQSVAGGTDMLQRAARRAEDTATSAASIGWHAAMRRALVDGGQAAYAARQFSVTRRLWQRLRAWQTDHGRLLEAAKTLCDVAAADAEDAGEALSIAEQREAIAILEQYPASAWDLAKARGNLGMLYARVGMHVEARDLQDAALRYWRSLLAEKDLPERRRAAARLEEAETLSRIGAIYFWTGRPEQAEAFYRDALGAYHDAGDAEGEAMGYGNLGEALSAVGNRAEAEDAFAKALLVLERERKDPFLQARLLRSLAEHAIRVESFDVALARAKAAVAAVRPTKDRRAVAEALEVLGLTHLARKDPKAALAAFDEGLDLVELPERPPSVVRMLQGKSRAKVALGDFEGALRDARRGVGALRGLDVGWSDEQSIATRGGFADLFASGALAALHLGRPDDLWTFFEAGRANVLLQSLGGGPALRVARLEPLEAEVARATKAEDEARAARDAAVEMAAAKDAAKALEAAERVRQDAVERLERERRATAEVLRPLPDEMEHVRDLLGADEALVTFGLFPTEAVALVLTKRGAKSVSLGPRDVIEAACDALLPPTERGEVTDDSDARDRLRAMVVDPLHLDADVHRVLVSPDRSLAYVPFAWLDPGHDWAFVASGTVYARTFGERFRRGSKVLALGDPAYGSASPDPLAMRGVDRWVRLVDSGRQAQAVGDEGKVLLREQATVPGFLSALRQETRWRAVVFGCHGLLDDQVPALSALVLAPTPAHNGLLRVRDLAGMKIESDLAVLSACRTAKGKFETGEGPVGLTRAFMLAGTPRVLATLWDVEDEAASALIVAFFDRWKKGEGVLASLRGAQEVVRHGKSRDGIPWAHPKYWAAWVLWGLPE